MPDVILLDIEMPRMDGFEFAKTIKSDPKYPNIPIIMITSRTAEKHRNRAAELGVDLYLGKPYQEEELLKHLREMTGVGARIEACAAVACPARRYRRMRALAMAARDPQEARRRRARVVRRRPPSGRRSSAASRYRTESQRADAGAHLRAYLDRRNRPVARGPGLRVAHRRQSGR